MVTHSYALMKPKQSKCSKLFWTTQSQTYFKTLRDLISNLVFLHLHSHDFVLLDLIESAEMEVEETLPIQRFTLIQPPVSELNEIFESSDDNESRNNEMIRRAALFAENAGKYDILERIRFRVGGLSSELGDLVRRVLSSRQISSNILKKLGTYVL